MQKIKAGGIEIEVEAIYGETVHLEGGPAEALRVSLPAPVTQEQLAALTAYPWEIYSEEGVLQGIQDGARELHAYETVFYKVPEAVLLRSQLQEAWEKAELYKNALQAQGIDTSSPQFMTQKELQMAQGEFPAEI